jgi:inhibitor of KinA sporulation pathway (predicted exonuclease)
LFVLDTWLDGLTVRGKLTNVASNRLNLSTLEIEDEFQVYVKPVHNPKLSDFCTSLTGITQEMVDGGVVFTDALSQYETWLMKHGLVGGDKKFTFVTCGDWDLKSMLPAQCDTSCVKRPGYFDKWINIKFPFGDCYKTKALGMAGMLRDLKIPLKGRHHSGIDDCRNITSIVKRSSFPSFFAEPCCCWGKEADYGVNSTTIVINDGWILDVTCNTQRKENVPPLAFVSVLGKGRMVLSNTPNRKYLLNFKVEQGLTHIISVLTNSEGAQGATETSHVVAYPSNRLMREPPL